MTKRDYILIAEAIMSARAKFANERDEDKELITEAINTVAHHMSDGILASDRGRFDAHRFLTACGIKV